MIVAQKLAMRRRNDLSWINMFRRRISRIDDDRTLLVCTGAASIDRR